MQTYNFLGATVRGFEANGNLGDQPIGVRIDLVEDNSIGQVFSPPPIGSPASIEVSGFRFDGLLQYHTRSSGTGGTLITAYLQSVGDLLGGVQVIVDGFRGSVSDVPNVINTYGFQENLYGFGSALTNAGGAPWNYPISALSVSASGALSISGVGYLGVKPALESIVNNGAGGGVYGSGIYFNNHHYVLNLSGIQADLGVPSYYRINGPTISLSDLFNGLYSEAGHDYITVLTTGAGYGPHTISFKSIDRTVQPTLNQIHDFINAQSNVISSDRGLELRNEPTSIFLIGGQQEQLSLITNTGSNVYPFFGLNTDGTPVIGSGVGDYYRVDLNAAPIADVLGYLTIPTLKYNVSFAELRCALADYDSWAAYVATQKTSIAQDLGIFSAVSNDNSPIADIITDFIADDVFTANIVSSGITSHIVNLTGKLYDFVKATAETYYGKQFMVVMPTFNALQLESETNNVKYAYVPTNSAYLPEGSSPLGLSYLNELTFLDEEGKFKAFSLFQTDLNLADLSNVNPDSSVLQDVPAGSNSFTSLYIGCNVQETIYKIPGTNNYAALINYDQPLFSQSDSSLGNIADIAAILGTTPTILINACDNYGETFPMRIYPRAYAPDYIALPIRSNIDNYGPWGKIGPQGKTTIEIDSSLNPWTYGGYTALNQAANARIINAATLFLSAETGNVELPGFPEKSIGDQLVGAGSEITSVSLSYGIDGVKTKYGLHTYTPRRGVFAKAQAERVQKIGTALVALRKRMRIAELQRKQSNALVGSYNAGMLTRLGVAVNQESPQGVIVGHSRMNPSGDSMLSLVSSQKYKESVANIKVTKTSVYQRTAAMSMDGLLRPMSTNKTLGSGFLPHYEAADTRLISAQTNDTVTPWCSGSDIQWVSWGSGYNGLNVPKRGIDYSNTRFIGMKGPMSLAGFGYDVWGKPVPNASGYNVSGIPLTGVYNADLSNNFYTNGLKRQDLWKAGTLADIRWCPYRKVWAQPSLFDGITISGGIVANSSGYVDVVLGNGTNMDRILIYNDLNVTVPSGKHIYFGFFALENKYKAISSDC